MKRWIIDPNNPDTEAERHCLAYLIRKYPREGKLHIETLKELLAEGYIEKAQEEFAREEFDEALGSLQQATKFAPSTFLEMCKTQCYLSWVDEDIGWEGWKPRARTRAELDPDLYPTVEEMLDAIREYRDGLPKKEEYTLIGADDPGRGRIGFATEERQWYVSLSVSDLRRGPYRDAMRSAPARSRFAEELWNRTD